MNQQQNTLTLGDVRFSDAALAQLAQQQGSAAAWQEAWTRLGPAGAARAAEGSFAVGLRQGPERGFIAVDRFAEQTLCWRIDEAGGFRFAARADELGAPGDLDPQALFDYLYFHCIPSPRTIFKDVYRLPPGHYASFENGQVTVAPYWQPVFAAPREAVSFEKLKQEFRLHLRESVARQLDGSKPACFLSGGTDSSTVAGMIREASGQQPASYSIGFEAEGYDEMAYARIAARRFDTEHHEYYVTPQDLVDSIPSVAAHYDQPFGNSSALPAYYCARMAHDNGVSKLLAGDGGDELFGGNSRYAKQRIFGWYQHLPAALRSGLMEPLFESSWASNTRLLSKGSSYIEQAKVPMPARLQMYNLLLRLDPQQVLTPGFLERIDRRSPDRHQQSVWDQVGQASELNRTLAFDWRYTLGESDLPKVRETTALAGVRVGFPMLDQALLDFSLRLPDDYKLKGLKLRWFFKEALRGFLPDEILVKKKQGFGLPFGVWLMRHPGLMSLARESLLSLGQRGIVRPDFIQGLIHTHLPAHPGYYGEMVWILMMLEQWLLQRAPAYRQ
jgi:asparagine synthase (glutamine-hydrolysing)